MNKYHSEYLYLGKIKSVSQRLGKEGTEVFEGTPAARVTVGKKFFLSDHCQWLHHDTVFDQ